MRHLWIQNVLSTAVLCTAATSFGAGAAAGTAAPAPAPAPSGGTAASGGTLLAPPQGPNAGSSLFGPVQGPSAGSSLFGPVQGPTAGSSLFGPQVGSPGSTGSSLFGGSSRTTTGVGTQTINGSTVITGSSGTSASGTGTAVIVPGPAGLPSGVSASGNVIVTNPRGTGVTTGVIVPGVIVDGGVGSVPAQGAPLSPGMAGYPSSQGETTPGAPGGTANGAPANVPAPGTFAKPDEVQVKTPALVIGTHAEIEGQLVDMNSGAGSTKTAMGSVIKERTTLGAIAETPASGHSVQAADVQVIVSGFKPSPTGPGTVASVNPTPAGQSFGATNRPGVYNSTGAAVDTVVTTRTLKSPDGKMTITVGTGVDPALASKELEKGVPAAVLVGNQMYTLACDSKQLASYAGQRIRVSGQINASGSLVPERFEVLEPTGDYRAVAISVPKEKPRINEPAPHETHIVTERD